MSRVWLGEIPLLALWQLPKTFLATWFRKHWVMSGIKWAGLSSGSFSPDYIAARPYGLAIVYLAVVLTVISIGWYRSCFNSPQARRLLWVFLTVAFADYFWTLCWSGGPGFTIY
jgi:hypothetical protein